jgi:hypothetical protein
MKARRREFLAAFDQAPKVVELRVLRKANHLADLRAWLAEAGAKLASAHELTRDERMRIASLLDAVDAHLEDAERPKRRATRRSQTLDVWHSALIVRELRRRLGRRVTVEEAIEAAEPGADLKRKQELRKAYNDLQAGDSPPLLAVLEVSVADVGAAAARLRTRRSLSRQAS